jgi:hypothetical protein
MSVVPLPKCTQPSHKIHSYYSLKRFLLSPFPRSFGIAHETLLFHCHFIIDWSLEMQTLNLAERNMGSTVIRKKIGM